MVKEDEEVMGWGVLTVLLQRHFYTCFERTKIRFKSKDCALRLKYGVWWVFGTR